MFCNLGAVSPSVRAVKPESEKQSPILSTLLTPRPFEVSTFSALVYSSVKSEKHKYLFCCFCWEELNTLVIQEDAFVVSPDFIHSIARLLLLKGLCFSSFVITKRCLRTLVFLFLQNLVHFQLNILTLILKRLFILYDTICYTYYVIPIPLFTYFNILFKKWQ